MDNVKDYKFNHSIYVLFEIIDSLEASYTGTLPSNVEKEMKRFKRVLIDNLEPKDKMFINRDYLKTEYFMRVYYENENQKKLH